MVPGSHHSPQSPETTKDGQKQADRTSILHYLIRAALFDPLGLYISSHLEKGFCSFKCFTNTVLVQSSHFMYETSRVQTDYRVAQHHREAKRQSWTKHVGFPSPIHSLSMNSGIASGQKSLRGILS